MNYIFKLGMLLISQFLLYSFIPFQFGNVLVEAKLKEKYLESILFAARKELKTFLHVTNQTKDFRQYVHQQVYSLFNPTPTQPSVLFFLFTEDSEETSDCLAQKLQNIVSRAFKDKNLISFDSKDLKLKDDKAIIRILSEKFGNLKNNHVAVLRNLDQLPPEAVMFLREYLDNEKVVHKRTLIILTMKKSIQFDSLPKENIKNDVEKTLEGLWKGKVRNADIPAVMARIMSAMVPVKPEPREVIASVCLERDEL